jgi:DNA-directed RNA polymerase subunit RPC12/RpoP
MEIRCPKCNSQARVLRGGITSTLAMPLTSWDENGLRHTNDPNKCTEHYECSNCGAAYSVETYHGVTTIKERGVL